jgi:hypothetical protein
MLGKWKPENPENYSPQFITLMSESFGITQLVKKIQTIKPRYCGAITEVDAQLKYIHHNKTAIYIRICIYIWDCDQVF